MAITYSYPEVTPVVGDYLVGTQISSSNATRNFTVGDVVNAGLGYKVYTALLTQTGVSDPVATVLKNNTTATLTWTRTAAGKYTVTADSSIFTANKTIVFMNYGKPPSEALFPKWVRISDTAINVSTQDEQTSFDDGVLNGAAFEIKIYS
ncbi:MAG: hypothetical protein GY928_38680 [Colwellia sp.]|nr:hypothetical protein [Colwellia sp.]